MIFTPDSLIFCFFYERDILKHSEYIHEESVITYGVSYFDYTLLNCFKLNASC